MIDQDGRYLGKVVALVANPASDLLELEGGGLIPLVFVVERSAGRIVVDIPEGLDRMTPERLTTRPAHQPCG